MFTASTVAAELDVLGTGRAFLPVEAAREAWQVHAWATEHDDRPLLARCHQVLAQTRRNLGDLSGYLEHAVASVDHTDDDTPGAIRAGYLLKLADALTENGSHDAARERYEQADQLCVAAGDVPTRLVGLNNRAYAEYQVGRLGQAWTVLERLRSVSTDADLPIEPNALDTIARVQLELGQFAAAEETIRRAVAAYHANGLQEPDALADFLLTLACVLRRRGRADDAQLALSEALDLCTERHLFEVHVRVLREQAELCAAVGDYENAYAWFREYHDADKDLHNARREVQARDRQALFETTEARREAAHFREQANRDPLTGLHNRRYVDQRLPALIDRSGPGMPLVAALVDIDHFKRINDLLSHGIGDQVLAAVADLLTTAAAAHDRAFAARIGGEEFLLVLPGYGLAAATDLLDGLRRAVAAHPWQAITGELPVTVSIGVTEWISEVNQVGLLACADRALYAAKRTGRDRVVAEPVVRRRYRDQPLATAGLDTAGQTRTSRASRPRMM